LVEKLDHRLTVSLIALGDRPLLDVLACAAANFLDVGEKRFASHGALISSLRSEARVCGIVHSAAPMDAFPNTGEPYRTQQDPRPEDHHQRMQENRIVQ